MGDTGKLTSTGKIAKQFRTELPVCSHDERNGKNVGYEGHERHIQVRCVDVVTWRAEELEIILSYSLSLPRLIPISKTHHSRSHLVQERAGQYS